MKEKLYKTRFKKKVRVHGTVFKVRFFQIKNDEKMCIMKENFCSVFLYRFSSLHKHYFFVVLILISF